MATEEIGKVLLTKKFTLDWKDVPRRVELTTSDGTLWGGISFYYSLLEKRMIYSLQCPFKHRNNMLWGTECELTMLHEGRNDLVTFSGFDHEHFTGWFVILDWKVGEDISVTVIKCSKNDRQQSSMIVANTKR